VSSQSGVWEDGPGQKRVGFNAFQVSQNASRRDVCRKLRSCQKTFINGITHEFDRLVGRSPMASPPKLLTVEQKDRQKDIQTDRQTNAE